MRIFAGISPGAGGRGRGKGGKREIKGKTPGRLHRLASGASNPGGRADERAVLTRPVT